MATVFSRFRSAPKENPAGDMALMQGSYGGGSQYLPGGVLPGGGVGSRVRGSSDDAAYGSSTDYGGTTHEAYSVSSGAENSAADAAGHGVATARGRGGSEDAQHLASGSSTEGGMDDGSGASKGGGSKKGRRTLFGAIPIPFSSRWAAQKQEQEAEEGVQGRQGKR